jgi:hypothetical protein
MISLLSWANLRRKNTGRDEPHNVKLWGLGNEMHGEWQVGRLSATDYTKQAARWAHGLKLVDPSIQVRLLSFGVLRHVRLLTRRLTFPSPACPTSARLLRQPRKLGLGPRGPRRSRRPRRLPFHPLLHHARLGAILGHQGLPLREERLRAFCRRARDRDLQVPYRPRQDRDQVTLSGRHHLLR